MIKTILGGIKIPIEPPPATAAQAKPESYPYFSISGTATFPKVAAVAALEPVAANIPQPIELAIARPPGNPPTILKPAEYAFWAKPAFNDKCPIKMNRGTEIMT